jgi:hypothetical protein
MLPMVAPIFIVPRIASQHLSHRLSGRAILALGFCLAFLGVLWLAAVVRGVSYGPMVGGMLLTGLGAGLLNGETTKVGMTAIPRERSGMASGVAGTMRFSGLVIGIAVLGTVLYSTVSTVVSERLASSPAAVRLAVIHLIVAGDMSGAAAASGTQPGAQNLSVTAFANGYRWLFTVSAVLLLIAAGLTWRLVDPRETQPVPKQS